MALTSSNAAPSGSLASSVLKRFSHQALTLSGTTSWKKLAVLLENLTRTLAIFDEPNISSPSLCLERSTEVLITLWAFFDVASENTITAPAATRNIIGLLAGPSRDDIMKVEGSEAPLAAKSV